MAWKSHRRPELIHRRACSRGDPNLAVRYHETVLRDRQPVAAVGTASEALDPGRGPVGSGSCRCAPCSATFAEHHRQRRARGLLVNVKELRRVRDPAQGTRADGDRIKVVGRLRADRRPDRETAPLPAPASCWTLAGPRKLGTTWTRDAASSRKSTGSIVVADENGCGLITSRARVDAIGLAGRRHRPARARGPMHERPGPWRRRPDHGRRGVPGHTRR